MTCAITGLRRPECSCRICLRALELANAPVEVLIPNTTDQKESA